METCNIIANIGNGGATFSAIAYYFPVTIAF